MCMQALRGVLGPFTRALVLMSGSNLLCVVRDRVASKASACAKGSQQNSIQVA